MARVVIDGPLLKIEVDGGSGATLAAVSKTASGLYEKHSPAHESKISAGFSLVTEILPEEGPVEGPESHVEARTR